MAFIDTSGHAADVASYAEAAYFAGFHFQHIAARDERERLEMIDRRARRAARAMVARDRRAAAR